MLYLVQGTITRHQYMGDSKSEKVIRLVEAADMEAASDKFITSFESDSSDYDVAVVADIDDISSVIS